MHFLIEVFMEDKKGNSYIFLDIDGVLVGANYIIVQYGRFIC